jgi:hypothetical protein
LAAPCGCSAAQYSSVRLQVDRIAASRTDFLRNRSCKGLTHARRVERHLLANRERGRMVIDAQSEQLHGDMTLKRDEKFRQGVLETDRAQTTRSNKKAERRPQARNRIIPGGSVHREPGDIYRAGTVCARHQAPPAKCGSGSKR